MSFVSLVFPSLALLFVLIITNSSAKKIMHFCFCQPVLSVFRVIYYIVLFRLMRLGEREERDGDGERNCEWGGGGGEIVDREWEVWERMGMVVEREDREWGWGVE